MSSKRCLLMQNMILAALLSLLFSAVAHGRSGPGDSPPAKGPVHVSSSTENLIYHYSLQKTRTMNISTGEVTYGISTFLEGNGITQLQLQTPNGEKFLLFRDNDSGSIKEVDIDVDLHGMTETFANTHFPFGDYIYLATFFDGETASISSNEGSWSNFPTLLQPSSGATDVSLTPTISWQASPGQYHSLEILSLDTLENYDFFGIPSASSSYTIPAGILDGGTNYMLTLISHGNESQTMVESTFKTHGSPGGDRILWQSTDSEYMVSLSREYRGYDSRPEEFELSVLEDFSPYSSLSLQAPNSETMELFSSPLAYNEFTIEHQLAVYFPQEYPEQTTVDPLGEFIFRLKNAAGTLMASYSVETPQSMPEFPFVLSPPVSADITPGTPIIWETTGEVSGIALEFDFSGNPTGHFDLETLLSPSVSQWNIPLLTDFPDQIASLCLSAVTLKSGTNTIAGTFSDIELPYFLVSQPWPQAWEQEHNDTPEKANMISAASPILGMIGQENDIDWYWFNGTQNEDITVEVSAMSKGSILDCYIEVWSKQITDSPVFTVEGKPAQSRYDLPEGKIDVIYGKREDAQQQLWRLLEVRAMSDDPGMTFTLPSSGKYYIKVAGHTVHIQEDGLGPFYEIQMLRTAKDWQMPSVVMKKPGGATAEISLFGDGIFMETLSDDTFSDSYPSGAYTLSVDFSDGTTSEFNYNSVESFPTIPVIEKPANQSQVPVPVEVQWQPVEGVDFIDLLVRTPMQMFKSHSPLMPDSTQTILSDLPTDSEFLLTLLGYTMMESDYLEDGRLGSQVGKSIQFSTMGSTTPTPTPPSDITVPSTEFPTIQSAIDAAGTGTKITVKPGTYFENINTKSKDIVLRSQNPKDRKTVESTIIDGGQTNSTITMGGLEPATCLIAGFTIQNGAGNNGGGINANMSLATIQGNRIVNNSATNGGGIRDSQGLIEDNYIAGNNADFGGGLDKCTGTVRNNTILENQAGDGGGIHSSSALIEANFIARNTARNSGGACASCDGNFHNNFIVNNSSAASGGAFDLCSGRIINNTFYGNRATVNGGALYQCQGTITNNIIWNNPAGSGESIQSSSTPNYCCVDQQIAGAVGNIYKDPLLANPDGNDFHLTEFSPCIDSGTRESTVAKDFDNETRPIDGTSEPRPPYFEVDIGADEFNPGPQRPDFTLQVLNPSVVVESKERPRFNISCQSEGQFNEKVTFSIPNAPFNYVFNPNPAQPPASVSLFLSRPSETQQDFTQQFTVRAVSASGDIVREASASYTVLGTASTDPKLILSGWPERIRAGSIAILRGKITSGESGIGVNISVTRLDSDGNMHEESAVSTTTNSDGSFNYEYMPGKIGTYTFKASSLVDGANIESNPVQVQVFSKISRISLKVDPQSELKTGAVLPFSGSLKPMIDEESSKVDLNVWYNPTELIGTTPDQTVQVDLIKGVYSGAITLNQSGIAVLQARWYGSPPEVEGTESPRVVVPVMSLQDAKAAQETGYNPGAAVLVAGATSENLLPSTRDYLTNLGYYMLRQRRYNDLKLEYMNDDDQQDYDGDGKMDPIVDIVESSVSGLSAALDTAVTQAGTSGPVSLFIVGEKGDGASLSMGDGSKLAGSDLDTLLTSKCGAARDVRVLVEASNCGDFCQAIAAPYRTVIGSASTETASYFSQGLLSFTQLFMTQVQAGWSIDRSFEYAKDYLWAALGFFGAQTPVMISSQELNPELLYYGISSDATDMLPPQIESIFEPSILEGTDEVDIFAWATDDTGVSKVEAMVRKPDGTTASILMLEKTSGSRRYEASLDRSLLDQLGTYSVSIVAVDNYKNSSAPASSQLSLIRIADLDGDSNIGPGDLYIIISEMHNRDSLYDIHLDGEMNSKDLMRFSKEWTK